MPEFEYNAKDAEGQTVYGRIQAHDLDQAVADLIERGLDVRPEDVVLLVGNDEEALDEAILLDDDHATPQAASAIPLSGSQTTELVGTIAGLAAADLPLSAGLRAAAEEAPHHRVATAMRHLANQLDHGLSLDAALASASPSIPAYLRGLMLAGLRTGRVADVLEQLVALDQERADLRRRILAALSYPSILVIMLLAGFILSNLLIIRPFSRIFEEFGVELPGITLLTIHVMAWFDSTGLWIFCGSLTILLAGGLVLLILPKPPEVQRACYRIPVVGPLWRWQSLVEFARLMQLLLERQIPMVEALQLTAGGLRWSDLVAVSRSCACDLQEGMGLSESMAKYREFPPSIHPVIASGLKAQQPAEAFGAAADMYRRRAGVDALLWETILPPIIVLLVAVGVGYLILAMFLPLIKLISSLT